MSIRLSTTAAGLALAAVGILAGTPVLACSPPMICKPRVSLASGAVIPANALGIPVLLPTPLQPPYLPMVPLLLDAQGKVVPTVQAEDAMGWTLLKPAKGFAANAQYVLRLPGFCNDGKDGVLPPEEITFTTAGKVPLPVTSGVLKLAAIAPDLVSVWTTSGSCTEAIWAAQGSVAVEATAALLPWRDLARAELRVDGTVWASSNYGDLPLAGEKPKVPMMGRTVHAFFAACGLVPKSADEGLQPGAHHVDLRIHIAGEFNDPPDLFGDLEVACSAKPGADAGVDGDTGPDADASVSLDAGQSPGAPSAAAADDGCNAGPAPASAGWPVALALGLAAAVVAWRRRIRVSAARVDS